MYSRPSSGDLVPRLFGDRPSRRRIHGDLVRERHVRSKVAKRHGVQSCNTAPRGQPRCLSRRWALYDETPPTLGALLGYRGEQRPPS